MAAVNVPGRHPSPSDGGRPTAVKATRPTGAPATSRARRPALGITDNQLRALLEHGTAADVADVLLSLSADGRHALAPPLNAIAAEPADPAKPTDEQRREAALLVAGAACLPDPSAVVTWLRARRYRHRPTADTVDMVLRVLGAPERPELTTIAAGMADRLRSRAAWPGEWTLTAALLRAAGMPPPDGDLAIRGWIREHDTEPAALAENLAADPWLDLLLPRVFAPGALSRHWPPALARLAADGRIGRDTLLGLVLARLAAGGKPADLRPVIAVHQALEPTLDELTATRGEHLALLSAPQVTVAALAQDALRALDEAGRLDLPALVGAGRAVFRRTDEELAPAQLAWLKDALGRHPRGSAALLEVIAEAAGHPSAATEALAVLGRQPGGLTVVRTLVDELPGTLAVRAESLLEAAQPRTARVFPPAPHPYQSPAMPAPITTVAELAAELAEPGLLNPVALERVLAAVVALGHRRPAELAAASVPAGTVRPPLDLLVRAIAGHPTNVIPQSDAPSRLPHYRSVQREKPGLQPTTPPLQAMLLARIQEISDHLIAGTLPPALLATPATIDGHVNPARVLLRLIEAERDGWQPGPYDLTQALLRLPRKVDPALSATADRLTSAAGVRFAAWLRTGGLPDPTVTVPPTPTRRVPAFTWPDSIRTLPLDGPGLTAARALLNAPTTPLLNPTPTPPMNAPPTPLLEATAQIPQPSPDTAIPEASPTPAAGPQSSTAGPLPPGTAIDSFRARREAATRSSDDWQPPREDETHATGTARPLGTEPAGNTVAQPAHGRPATADATLSWLRYRQSRGAAPRASRRPPSVRPEPAPPPGTHPAPTAAGAVSAPATESTTAGPSADAAATSAAGSARTSARAVRVSPAGGDPTAGGPTGGGLDLLCWPMVLPGHRDVVAVHCGPYLVGAGAAGVVGGLARAAGPFGAGMAILLARGLAGTGEPERAAAVGAVLHLAGCGGLDARLLGRELKLLLGAEPDAAGWAAASLERIGVAGGWHPVWAVAYAVVPALLGRPDPPAGLGALLDVATAAATAIGARAEIPEVAAAALDHGSPVRGAASRLARAIR